MQRTAKREAGRRRSQPPAGESMADAARGQESIRRKVDTRRLSLEVGKSAVRETDGEIDRKMEHEEGGGKGKPKHVSKGRF